MPLLDAVEHLLAAGRAEAAAGVFLDNRLHEDLDRWGHYLFLDEICGRLMGRPIAPAQKLALAVQSGKIARNRGELEKARAIYEAALPLIEDGSDRWVKSPCSTPWATSTISWVPANMPWNS